jgi:hypothetical protein
MLHCSSSELTRMITLVWNELNSLRGIREDQLTYMY